MVEVADADGGVASFPVVFFDGESETSIGSVVIHSEMDFRDFQSILSSKIGISTQQFSVCIVDNNNSRNRFPVTQKVNFSLVCRWKDCFSLVVLKRSRRWGTRKMKNAEASPPAVVSARKEPPANTMLLRRGGGGGGGGNNSMDSRIYAGLEEFEKRVTDLQMEKERYTMNLGRTNMRIEKESKSLVQER